MPFTYRYLLRNSCRRWAGQHQLASRPPTATRSFVPVAQHWIVERTFAWLNYFRRVVVDYDRTPASQAAWLFVANLIMSLRRATSL